MYFCLTWIIVQGDPHQKKKKQNPYIFVEIIKKFMGSVFFWGGHPVFAIYHLFAQLNGFKYYNNKLL